MKVREALSRRPGTTWLYKSASAYLVASANHDILGFAGACTARAGGNLKQPDKQESATRGMSLFATDHRRLSGSLPSHDQPGSNPIGIRFAPITSGWPTIRNLNGTPSYAATVRF